METQCGPGVGLAVCPQLGLVVTSNFRDALDIFALPGHALLAGHVAQLRSAGAATARLASGTPPAPLVRVGTFGRGDLFDFSCAIGYSGYLAFSGPLSARALLVTDAGHQAVHVVDAVNWVHVGYVATPGTIVGPRGVAARSSMAAVSAFEGTSRGDHVVHLFEGTWATWVPLRVIGIGGYGPADHQFNEPDGLRFCSDGVGLVVSDTHNRRVSYFRVADGTLQQHLAVDIRCPYDVEECQGGWLVARLNADRIDFVAAAPCDFKLESESGPRLPVGCGDSTSLEGPVVTMTRAELGAVQLEVGTPVAMSLVPDVGLFVRDYARNCLQLFLSPDVVDMACMSADRVAWMVAVVRGTMLRQASRASAASTPARQQRVSSMSES